MLAFIEASWVESFDHAMPDRLFRCILHVNDQRAASLPRDIWLASHWLEHLLEHSKKGMVFYARQLSLLVELL